MSGTDSVGHWLAALKAGRRDDAAGAWDRYVRRLVRLAGARLPNPVRRAPHDISGGEFRRLLVWTAARRAVSACQQRDGDQARDERAPADDDRLTQILSAEPTPEAAARFAGECERLIDGFGDATLRRIALLTLEGHSLTEIAVALGTSPRTIERKWNVIRATWEQAPT